MSFFWLAVLSLLVRLGFAPFTPFGLDEAYLADRFTDMSAWPTSGGIVAYDGSLRLGTMLTWLAGVPIKLAGGSPLGGMLALSVYGFVEAMIVLWIYRRLFPAVDGARLGALILLAPWTIVFQSLFHASFTPIFGLMFFCALLRLMRDSRDFLGWALMPVSFLGSFQIGLYFVPLLLVLAFCFWARIIAPRVNARGALAGLLFVSVPLFAGRLMPSELPYYPFNLKHPAYAATSTVPHPYVLKEIHALERSSSEARQGLVNFDFERMLKLPGHLATLLLRFLTFTTAETLRFTGPGLGANVALMNGHPWLWMAAPLALGFSGFMVFMGMSFYFDRRLMARVRNAVVRRAAPGDLQERLDVVAWLLPLAYAASFVFSVKGPSAHTFWMVWPFAFYPLLRRWDLRSRFFPGYVAAALVFSVGGSMVNHRQVSLFRASSGLAKPGSAIQGVLLRQSWIRGRD